MKHLLLGTAWIIVIIFFSFLFLIRFLWDFYFDWEQYKEMWVYREFCQVILNSFKQQTNESNKI